MYVIPPLIFYTSTTSYVRKCLNQVDSRVCSRIVEFARRQQIIPFVRSSKSEHEAADHSRTSSVTSSTYPEHLLQSFRHCNAMHI